MRHRITLPNLLLFVCTRYLSVTEIFILKNTRYEIYEDPKQTIIKKF